MKVLSQSRHLSESAESRLSVNSISVEAGSRCAAWPRPNQINLLASREEESADGGRMDLFSSSLQGNDIPIRPTMSLADMIAEDGAVNKSFSSAISAATSASGGGASSSSKAVLAALRALQDKIRRLETERSHALDEASQLRLQLKNQEIEHEHAKQREQLAAQKSLQEARTSYDRLTGEKADLEARLHRVEEKNRSLTQASDELQGRIRHLEEEKHQNSLRLRDLESQQQVLEQQIRMAQQREKGCFSLSLRISPTFLLYARAVVQMPLIQSCGRARSTRRSCRRFKVACAIFRSTCRRPAKRKGYSTPKSLSLTPSLLSCSL